MDYQSKFSYRFISATLFITYSVDHNEILHTSRVQIFVVINLAHFRPEHFKFLFHLIEIPLAGRAPGPWFNIKMLSYQYRKSHCGDTTVVRSSYLHNGISYTGKISSLYWVRALVIIFQLQAQRINVWRPEQNGWHIADASSWKKILCLHSNFTQKKYSCNSKWKKLAFVQMVAWHWTHDTSLPEPMMTQVTHWVDTFSKSLNELKR